jgi:hypothetical protein
MKVIRSTLMVLGWLIATTLFARDSAAEERFEFSTISFRGQAFVQFKSSSIDCMCLAKSASFDSSSNMLYLQGDVLVDVKGQSKLQAGEMIVIDAAKGQVTISQPLSHKPTESAGKRADELWIKYKVEFVARTAKTIDVVTLSESDPVPFVVNGCCWKRVVESRPLLGGKSELSADATISLGPEPDSNKVFLVNYHGREPRNWIPYDKDLEAKLRRFFQERGIR